MVKLTEFQVGYCTHVACMALKGAGWRVCKFPARVYLLEVAGQRWLWDTGYSVHFYRCTQSGLFSLYRKVTPVYFQPVQSLLQQLQQQGINADDIQGVLISHFHADHIAGLRDFSRQRYYCSAQAWQSVKSLRGLAALKRGFIPDLLPADFADNLQFIESFELIDLPSALAPFSQGYALPGSNKKIILVSLPGHAAGQIGAFVATEQGWVLLASDAAWSEKNYQQLRLPSSLAYLVMDNQRAYKQTIHRLHQLYQGGQVEIKLCHEGDL